MPTPQSATPPLSPVLLAGLPLQPLPPRLLQPGLDALMSTVHQRHPDVFERLSGIAEPVFAIDPIDLPLGFVLQATADAPRLSALSRDDDNFRAAPATIRGPLLSLLALLEGNIDGDALFFARDLTIEGDTEAVVALRNAVDGAEIDLMGDALTIAGPLAGPAKHVLGLAGRLFGRAAADLELVRNAILEPATRRLESQARQQQAFEQKLAEIGKPARRSRERSA